MKVPLYLPEQISPSVVCCLLCLVKPVCPRQTRDPLNPRGLSRPLQCTALGHPI